MAQFVAFDKNAKASGRGLLVMVKGIRLAKNEAETTALLQKHNLYPLLATKWYLQQDVLDMMRELNKTADLVALGISMPEPELFPALSTISDALNMLNTLYQMDHQGGEVGYYEFIQHGNFIGRMICHNPYPADFDFGLLYAILKHYNSEDTMYIDWDRTRKNRKDGADSCEFILEW